MWPRQSSHKDRWCPEERKHDADHAETVNRTRSQTAILSGRRVLLGANLAVLPL